MAKIPFRNKPSSFLTDGFLFVGGATVALLLLFSLCYFLNPNPTSNNLSTTTLSDAFATTNCTQEPLPGQGINLLHEPPAPTFYDDPNLSYTIEKPIKNWDEKRWEWLNLHPSFAAGLTDRIFLISGSQPSPCRNPVGDHLLLRFFKNKVDYCRIHGYDIFYNAALFHPKMATFWAKIPVVRAAMMAHPESEWIWWVDSDAAFTDMDFKLPLEKYRDHNLIVHGWPDMIFRNRSWVGLNAGVFLIRNCQWSMDFMDVWASMGPISPDYEKWGGILKSTFKDKVFRESDDQSALVYLMLKENEKWTDRIYVESEYYFEGYWYEIVGTLDEIGDAVMAMERRVRTLRRRHAEKVSVYYSALRDTYVKEVGGHVSRRRPLITHFTGCQPCNGAHNKDYSWDSCRKGMERVLNFADNQVLRNFGFVHNHLDDLSVSPLPFDFPH